MTPKVWAQKRNFNKGQVKGMAAMCRSLSSSPITTRDEKHWLMTAAHNLEQLHKTWDLGNPVSKKLCTREVTNGNEGKR